MKCKSVSEAKKIEENEVTQRRQRHCIRRRKRQLIRHFRPFFRHLAAAAVFGGLLEAKRVYVHETLLKYGNFE